MKSINNYHKVGTDRCFPGGSEGKAGNLEEEDNWISWEESGNTD